MTKLNNNIMGIKKYTVEEFEKYLLKQDSLGDIFHNLSEENIEEANSEDEDEDEDEDYDIENDYDL